MSNRELHSFSWSGQEFTEQRDMGKRKKKVRLDNREGEKGDLKVVQMFKTDELKMNSL